jgi:hypothetical protein
MRLYQLKPINQNRLKFVHQKLVTISKKTFDLHFSKKGWYEGNMNEENSGFSKRHTKKKLSLLS